MAGKTHVYLAAQGLCDHICLFFGPLCMGICNKGKQDCQKKYELFHESILFQALGAYIFYFTLALC